MYTNNNIIFDVTEYKPGRNTMLMPSYLDQQNYFEVNTSEIYDHFPKHCRFDRTNIEINIIAYSTYFLSEYLYIYDKQRCQYWNHYAESTFVHILVGINEIIYSRN